MEGERRHTGGAGKLKRPENMRSKLEKGGSTLKQG